MKKIITLLLTVISVTVVAVAQDMVIPDTDDRAIEAASEPEAKSKFMIGFNLALPRGTWPSTALSNMGTTSFLEEQNHPVKSYGIGILMQMRIADNFSIFLDGNTYNYNILIGKAGADVQSVWTVSESAIHWDEAGAPHIQYVANLPTDVHFDMQATGFRLGGKYFFLKNKIRPWVGAGFGFYEWEVNYFNEVKDKTYGSDRGYITGLTYMAGIDFELINGIFLTAFVDMASPVASYQIEGLFYPQWDINYDSHIMGTNRFGISLSFASISKTGRTR
jgi:hypothetical protein